jgi:hypothetical protein
MRTQHYCGSTTWQKVSLVLAGLVVVAVPALVNVHQTDAQQASPPITKITMNTFVIIFRQEKPLSKDQFQERAEATRPWAKRLNDAGHNLSPRFLAPQSHWSASDERNGTKAPGEVAPITALLFLEAENFDKAVEIARSHPAVEYGATVEVRPWAATAPPPQP